MKAVTIISNNIRVFLLSIRFYAVLFLIHLLKASYKIILNKH